MTYVWLRFREECSTVLSEALSMAYPHGAAGKPTLDIPPSSRFGELASALCFDLAKAENRSPNEVANELKEKLDRTHLTVISSVEVVGGYLNFRIDYPKVAPEILATAINEDTNYGFVKTDRPLRIVVEHTSANPSGPLHMGHARNALLGDAVARMLRARGHNVKTHFYIDDVGKQVALLGYGYSKVNLPEAKGKADEWLGILYAITNCIVEIRNLNARLKEVTLEDERGEIQKELGEWVNVAREVENLDVALFNSASQAIPSDRDPMVEVDSLVRSYEQNRPEARKLVRGVAEKCLEGIKETLAQMGVSFDSWDWESDVVWSGTVNEVLEKLRHTAYCQSKDGMMVFEANRVLDDHALRPLLGLSANYEVPPLTLVRSDGTTLYATRDLAYTFHKFREADRVINVIGVEQTAPQLQLRLALFAMGQKKHAENLVHLAYGLVDLPGIKMSKRRARYITLDDILEQTTQRAREEVHRRSEDETRDLHESIASRIAKAAIRYAMVGVTSTKKITFTWDRVLSFERNSGPFINYAYTRACGILRRLGEPSEKTDYTLLTNDLEKSLAFDIARWPEVFTEASDALRPDDIAVFANNLAEKFHKYYEKINVLRADSNALKIARAGLVRAVRNTINNAMGVLGIELTERM